MDIMNPLKLLREKAKTVMGRRELSNLGKVKKAFLKLRDEMALQKIYEMTLKEIRVAMKDQSDEEEDENEVDGRDNKKAGGEDGVFAIVGVLERDVEEAEERLKAAADMALLALTEMGR